MMLLVVENLSCPLPPVLPDDPMQPLTAAQFEWVVQEAGWPADLWDEAYTVAGCESVWRPGAADGVNRGLFQVVFFWPWAAPGEWDGWHSWLVREHGLYLDWYDPVQNATAAYLIYQRSRGWSPWPNCMPEETDVEEMVIETTAP